eukprot:JP435722.1.p1 GENE.JP435722.1~~JP435722.1.p1  ORF type:complete len:369 (+),score=134.07 JP435722.1:42-1148(+)
MTSQAGCQTFVVFGVVFEIEDRYSLLKPLGQGSYGVVCSCKDNKTGQKVAIKKIPNAFEDAQDVKRLLREIRLLRHFDHENIIGLRNLLKAPGDRAFEDLYIVTELMDTDLYQIIASKQGLSDDHYQYFLYQMLRGVKYLHTANVIHRDMKPSNLLVNENCDLKICDFGLARVFDTADPLCGDLTQYVITRWYRPPELLLSAKEYTRAVDLWSVGCIFAELIGRRPLFPGKDYYHQLSLITDVIGTPADDDFSVVGNEKSRNFLRKLPHKNKIPFSKIYPKANHLAIDLLEKMLTFNPKKRITIEAALSHPYLKSLYDPAEDPCNRLPENHTEFDFEFETLDSLPELQDLVLKEVLFFDPDRRQKLAA